MYTSCIHVYMLCIHLVYMHMCYVIYKQCWASFPFMERRSFWNGNGYEIRNGNGNAERNGYRIMNGNEER